MVIRTEVSEVLTPLFGQDRKQIIIREIRRYLFALSAEDSRALEFVI